MVFLAGPGNYHVAARHRNHFGSMTATFIVFGNPDTDILGPDQFVDRYLRDGGSKVLEWPGNVMGGGCHHRWHDQVHRYWQ